MTKPTALLWLRQDLRLHDNPALTAALKDGFYILPVFVLDDENAGEWKHGGASRWWLHQSLTALNTSMGGRILFLKGDAASLIPKLVQDAEAKAVYWNRCYEPWRIACDKNIKEDLAANGIEAKSFNANLLWEPWEVLKDDGTPYKVFTPYYRRGCLGKAEPAAPKPAPKDIPYAQTPSSYQSRLTDLGLMPLIKWYSDMADEWSPGEDGAKKRLKEFLNGGLQGYKEGRNYPACENVSRLSPHLHFGEISPRYVWHEARGLGMANNLETDLDNFCSELGWREFSHSLLYHFPDLPRKPLQEKFEAFPWHENAEYLERWQKGQTGIPLVDAGMRQLWHTGWMHNRVRMVVGSFLVKNLLLHWHHGEDWFWDTLVDADLANNSASWQWIAGCGADAAPYFRVFNPQTQAEKFDADETYIRKWVPEYGTDKYARATVDLKASRTRALEAYQEIR